MIDRYSRPEMAAIWTLENRYRNWFKVEQAVCQAWNEQVVIPDEDLKNIMVDMDFDIDRILEIEQTTRHDVIAFLTYLEEKIGPSARFIHLGCTSSDIVDTAGMVQMAEAGALLVCCLSFLVCKTRIEDEICGFQTLLSELKHSTGKNQGLSNSCFISYTTGLYP